MYQGLFLDDRQEEDQFASFLSVEGEPGLSTSFQLVNQPLEKMANAVLERQPELLALDYRLDDAQTPGDVEVRYKAGPLAQQLRDHASNEFRDDFPIILISHENIIQTLYKPDLTAHDLFDRIYEKEKLVTNRIRIGKELLSLVEGYKAIISQWEGAAARLEHLLKLTDGEEHELLLGNQELRQWQGFRAPHQLARAILRNIIDRNGLLRDRPSLLARLGIGPDSPDIDKLVDNIKDRVGYIGIFHEGWARWWNHRIEALGIEKYGKELGNMTAEERVACWNEKFNLNLVPAKSLWTGSEEMFPSFACASCEYPTEKIHSVAAFDPIPSFVERKRICWNCVATGKYDSKELTIDDAELYIVEKIHSGEVRKEV